MTVRLRLPHLRGNSLVWSIVGVVFVVALVYVRTLNKELAI